MVSASRSYWGTACLVVLSAMYWIAAGFRATYRLLWYDELITWYLARQPDLKSIWSGITRGLDSEMVLVHCFVRISHALFGYGAFATRLPMLIGFWVLILGLYVFLKRRLPWQYALIGAIFPMLTFAWDYSFEARAYGLLLGCAATALVCWQNVTEGRARIPSLVGIALALAVALGCHPFAAVLAIPFALGEFVRTLDRRRIDWPVWVAFAVATPVMLAYPPLFAAVRNLNMNTGLRNVTTVIGLYTDALRPAIMPLLLAGLAGCVATIRLVPAAKHAKTLREDYAENRSSALPRYETAALFGFALCPLPLIAAMVARHGHFFPRYGILSVIGISGLIALLLFRAGAGSTLRGSAMLAVLMLWIAWATVKPAIAISRDPAAQFRQEHSLLVRGLSDGRPVAVNEMVLFLQADFYLDSALLQNLYYLQSEKDVERRHGWQEVNNLFARLLPEYVPLRSHTERWREFSVRDSFLFHITSGNFWAYEVLPREGWQMTLVSTDGGSWLYEARRSAAPTPDPAKAQ